MTKKIIVGAVILLAAAWVVNKTRVCSYAKAIFHNGAEQVRGQIPRELELARIKNEIGQMDRDYQKLLRVMAERVTRAKELNKEVVVLEANRKELAANLLTLSEAIEAKETTISYRGETYNLANAQTKASRELNNLKQLDKTLASKKKILEAEERNVDALKDQLDKLVSQKREFEVRVAELEANETELAATKIQFPVRTDEGRVADIKKTLDRIEHEQNVDVAQHELEKNYGTKIDGTNPPAQVGTPANVEEIRNYLQGKAGKDTKVAQSK
jgi:chromosome segregation ATPase